MRRWFLLALAAAAFAQDVRFGAESRLVVVPVAVTDSRGRPVDRLEAPDFRILDNGVEQRIVVETIGTGVAPIALVIAVQSSGISAAALANVRKVGAMIQPLITGERGCAAVVSFADRVAWLQECVNDGDAVKSALHSIEPGADKSARMVDAVLESIERLKARANVRRVLLLVSESRDRGSHGELETAAMAAQSADVSVYAITYSAMRTALVSRQGASRPVEKSPTPTFGSEPGSRDAPERAPIPPPTGQRVDLLGGMRELARLGKTNAAETLARATGGAVLSFTRQRGLEEAIQKLGAELHSQYVLGYVPSNREAGFHRIEVRVRRRGDVRVRARAGYWAPSSKP